MGKNLSQEQIIRIAVREGIRAANERMEFERAKEKKRAKDERLHNTKLLLRNYRAFKTHAEKSIYDATDCEDSVFDILAMMTESSFSRAESIVASIKNSAARTAIMVEHITAMIDTYKIICERSGKPENERRYRVIYNIYISDQPKTADEMSICESIDKRTIYKDIDCASETLASLIFGIDSLEQL